METSEILNMRLNRKDYTLEDAFAWLDEAEAALDALRGICKTLKKLKKTEQWGYVDDACDFVQEALIVERSIKERNGTAQGHNEILQAIKALATPPATLSWEKTPAINFPVTLDAVAEALKNMKPMKMRKEIAKP